jgi:hypothetical protein
MEESVDSSDAVNDVVCNEDNGGMYPKFIKEQELDKEND